jgi:hypothetical protein
VQEKQLDIGTMVRFTTSDREGIAGVVCRPISAGSPGHVLLRQEGYVHGVDASMEDVDLADEATEGFTQLAYTLIKLGSHIIEKTLV